MALRHKTAQLTAATTLNARPQTHQFGKWHQCDPPLPTITNLVTTNQYDKSLSKNMTEDFLLALVAYT